MGIHVPSFIRKIFFPPGVTPLPWKVLLTLLLLCTLHDIDIAMLFSFAPKLIKSFGVSEVNVGYYAGVLTSSLHCGILFASYFWSYFANKKGKKFAILVSSCLVAITILGFGFSTNLMWSLITRFLQGCCFGTANMRSVLTEQLDNTNMALGMSILMSSGVIALLIGPSLSGFLVFPTENYPIAFSNHTNSYTFLHHFPILLPHLVVFTFLVFGIALAVTYLPAGKEVHPKLSDGTGNSQLDNANNNGNLNLKSDSLDSPKSIDTVKCESLSSKFLRSKFMQVFRIRNCLLGCILFGVLGCTSVATSELFSLFSATSRKYNGMELTTAEMGAVPMVSSLFLIFIEIPLLTKTINKYGAKTTFIFAAFAVTVTFIAEPVIGMIQNKTVLCPLLYLVSFFVKFFFSMLFVSVNIVINNSCTPHLNASANGIGMTFTALGRTISPSIFGSLYAWSLNNIKRNDDDGKLGFPFDHFFAFFILATISILCGVFGTLVTKNANVKMGTTKNDIQNDSLSQAVVNEALEEEKEASREVLV